MSNQRLINWIMQMRFMVRESERASNMGLGGTDRLTKQREGGCMHGQVTDVDKATVRNRLQYKVSA
jgi:hypothetical protein